MIKEEYGSESSAVKSLTPNFHEPAGSYLSSCDLTRNKDERGSITTEYGGRRCYREFTLSGKLRKRLASWPRLHAAKCRRITQEEAPKLGISTQPKAWWCKRA